MADWIFDGANKIIKEPAGTGNTTFNFEQEIYSAWKRWVASGNAQYQPAFIVEGGTPIGATGLFTGATKILTNGWKLMAADHDHQVFIIGNFYSDDGIVSVSNPIGNSTIFASGTVGAQGISTNSGGSSVSVWTEQEKDNIIINVETTKRQATKAANNTETI
ncbi:hypothetical protein PANI_CDS0097 [Maribacter phage Panino]